MKVLEELSSPDSVAKRLKAIRAWQNIGQSELAAIAGVAKSAVGNWEQAFSRPRVEHAARICNRFRLSLDYIYLGRLDSIPYAVATALETAELGIDQDED